MKISLDGGALCSSKNYRFGNYTFARNLIEAIRRFDEDNEYYIYSFCSRPRDLILGSRMNFKNLQPKFLWSSLRLTLEEMINKKEVFLALNQSIPLFSSANIIGFSHGLSYLFYPQFYPDSQIQMKRQLKTMIDRATTIVVSSLKVKGELLSVYPACKKIVVFPFGIPFDMIDHKPMARERFFLFVGMNHPIKNVDFIVRAFKLLTGMKEYTNFKLYLVGDFKDYRDKNIVIFPYCDRIRLKTLYRRAIAYLTSSFYESFNFPVLEALSQDCPVIGLKTALIPEFDQYVYKANNLNEYLKLMKLIINNKEKKPVDLKKLKSQFSWEKYITNLKKLYQQ